MRYRQVVVLSVATIIFGLTLHGCGGSTTPTTTPQLPTVTAVFALAEDSTPIATVSPASVSTAASTGEPTAMPSELRISWGEWWYEGEYLANAAKYPADPEYHDRSFNIRVTIENASSMTVSGNVLPVFFLSDGEAERPTITWYYSADDLRPLLPGDSKEAVFRALTYASEQWISRVEVSWRGQVWRKELPKH